MKRHLWVNLADIGEKEKNFLLNVLVSLISELFRTSVEAVVGKLGDKVVVYDLHIAPPRVCDPSL